MPTTAIAPQVRTWVKGAKSWYISADGIKTDYDDWQTALNAWKDVVRGYLCRENGTLIDCK